MSCRRSDEAISSPGADSAPLGAPVEQLVHRYDHLRRGPTDFERLGAPRPALGPEPPGRLRVQQQAAPAPPRASPPCSARTARRRPSGARISGKQPDRRLDHRHAHRQGLKHIQPVRHGLLLRHGQHRKASQKLQSWTAGRRPAETPHLRHACRRQLAPQPLKEGLVASQLAAADAQLAPLAVCSFLFRRRKASTNVSKPRSGHIRERKPIVGTAGPRSPRTYSSRSIPM